ncbi:hypothetical protein CHLRE_09g412400v5 [Chlamydomonas reinhardtii]|uniref:Uncharacterized protein n=1 Tax=Chlamydomonas reinhardtii TaxID=3055 RepID=A8J4T0_CHLRE|nr:uncharacterized protein CHLRE_09g412400v5 [Chlamydomonas reinhardtii]PNW79363.1 hypothetical protein CHLRE_09g412400v5 [Chlamydomonas reinhardtii]|eukprot:XP_001696708.1 predicted protein [Chlamydomonas reinhardtii]
MPKRSQKHASEDDSEVALDEEYEASEDAPSDDDSDYEEQPAKKGKKTPSNKENKPPAKSAKTPSSGAKPQEKVIERLRKSLYSSINAQMVYKKGMKYGSSRVNVEIPNMTPADVEAMLGDKLYGRASKGPKQVSVTTGCSDELEDVMGRAPYKSLRYGAALVLHNDTVKLVYSRETGILKATAACVMLK